MDTLQERIAELEQVNEFLNSNIHRILEILDSQKIKIEELKKEQNE